MNVQELIQAEREAFDNYQSVDGKLQRIILEREREAKRRIAEEMKDETNNVQSLYSTYQDAKRARELAEVEESKNKIIKLGEEEAAPGDKVIAIHKPWDGYNYGNPVTILGILELVTHETKFADNLASYSRPSIGMIIVRLCNKDGKPSKKFASLERYSWKKVKP